MPNPNTSPPGYFRTLSALAANTNMLRTKLEEAGVEAAALPEADPVRVAVETKVAEAVSALESNPDYIRYRTYDENYVEP